MIFKLIAAHFEKNKGKKHNFYYKIATLAKMKSCIYN